MKIHLIRSKELSHYTFEKVYSLLTSIPGPIEFLCKESDRYLNDEEALSPFRINSKEEFTTTRYSHNTSESWSKKEYTFPMTRETATWQQLFSKISRIRQQENIPSDQLLVLLTDIPNAKNWFSSFDPEFPTNGFIHTDDWEFFLSCDSSFPIAYEVIALMLHSFIFEKIDDILAFAHEKPMGCISDLCMQKSDIILKMRTADICPVCLDKIALKLPDSIIEHSLNILDSLREKMLYAQSFRQRKGVSRLRISRQNELYLPDFANIEIKLYPLEKALYFLFLRYKDGIYMTDLPNHNDELFNIYRKLEHNASDQELNLRVRNLTSVRGNAASERFSRIKREFTSCIGPELAAHYIIQGPNAQPKKIALNRDLVSYT